MSAFKINSLLIIALLFAITAEGQSLRLINLHANKLIYDAQRDKIYATVSGLDTQYGNSLVQINPYSGVIENSIVVGSEPTCMDITKDNNYAYIGLDGASLVKRVNLNTFQIDRSISLGNGPSGPHYAEDVATSTLTPDLLIVSRKKTNVSPRHAGVAAYLNGTKLPDETPDHTGSNVIESADDRNLIVGYNSETSEYGIRRMSIDTLTGVMLTDVTPNMYIGTNFEFEDGLLYGDEGYIIDPLLSAPSLVGTYGNLSYRHVVEADVANNKTFFCTLSNGLKIKRYNLQTMTFIDETNWENVVPANFTRTTDLIRYGDRGLAMIVKDGFFSSQNGLVILYESCLVKDGADLSVTAKLSNTPISKNDTINLKIVVSNLGNVLAQSVLITDTLNPTFEVISASASAGTVQVATNLVLWSIDTLASNQSDTANITIHVTQPGTFQHAVYASSASFDCYTPDNSTIDSIKVEFATGIVYEADRINLSVFPNPVDDFLNIALQNRYAGYLHVRISDMNGRVLFSEKIPGSQSEHEIDFRRFKSGIYILTVRAEDGLSTHLKVIKR
ncbi:MAG: T9SS type A sorting domain-containing protein [Bacteroidia bacterium]|nr:T9SS type A sorting domain-containing protein [Bacteroidia bacterium]